MTAALFKEAVTTALDGIVNVVGATVPPEIVPELVVVPVKVAPLIDGDVNSWVYKLRYVNLLLVAHPGPGVHPAAIANMSVFAIEVAAGRADIFVSTPNPNEGMKLQATANASSTFLMYLIILPSVNIAINRYQVELESSSSKSSTGCIIENCANFFGVSAVAAIEDRIPEVSRAIAC